jgi:hypothetical protein
MFLHSGHVLHVVFLGWFLSGHRVLVLLLWLLRRGLTDQNHGCEQRCGKMR